MGDVGLAVQRAEDKTAQMQARAGAIDELIASGALDDQISLGGGDDIDRELAALSSTSSVEAELAQLKAAQSGGAISAGESPKAIDAEGPAVTGGQAQPVSEPVERKDES
jgi:phage shock protein A